MTQEEEEQLERQIEITKELEKNNNDVIHKLQDLRKTAMRHGGVNLEDTKWLVRELINAADFRADVYADWLVADEAQMSEWKNGG